jgi:shikimate kinase
MRLPAADVPAQAICLVGFMGAGKTSVGRALGQRLRWIFEDLDDRIEQREGRSVSEIFQAFGEAEFRRAERAALREVLEEVRRGLPRVVSLGGGAFAQKGTATLFRAAKVPTVFLDAPVKELWKRCKKQAKDLGVERPLLGDEDCFSELYQSRRRSYLKASLKIETGSRTVQAVARQIAETLVFRTTAVRNN